MNELKIYDNDHIFSIIIKQYNYILYKNKIDIMKFIKLFYDSIEKNTEIYINNNLITSKEYVIINLMDTMNIVNNLKYNKNTLLYEYLKLLINNNSEMEIVNINNLIVKDFSKIIKKSKLNIVFDINDSLFEIFNATLDINFKYNFIDVERNINILLNYILKSNPEKKFIIFLDTNLLKIKLKQNNFYLFDITDNYDIKKYNLFFNNDFQNFEYKILIDNIKLSWPKAYKDDEIELSLYKYINLYFKNDSLTIKDENIKIVNSIFNKLYNFSQMYTEENHNIAINNSNSIEII